MKPGTCYLVGAGPGDPGLMTVRGIECLRKADVVFYDHLVSEDILAEAPAYAELVYVGKESGRHRMRQEQINRLLCEAVGRGRVVVRLKGGDPFVFGRGGEEALALAQANLPFHIIPGVTAGVAAAAYAGIPVTHRGLSTAVTFVAGHEALEDTGRKTDWGALAGCSHTLCIYMGVRNLRSICEALIRGGRPPAEPAAIVEWGTYPGQRCFVGTLSDIAKKADRERVKPPAMVVVGEVVSLRELLQWFHPSVPAPQDQEGLLRTAL